MPPPSIVTRARSWRGCPTNRGCSSAGPSDDTCVDQQPARGRRCQRQRLLGCGGRLDLDRSHPADSGEAAGGHDADQSLETGYAPFDGTILGLAMTFTLDPVATVPDGMVLSRAERRRTRASAEPSPTSGWIGTRSAIGGSRRSSTRAVTDREFWKEPFVEKRQPVSWERRWPVSRHDRSSRPSREFGTLPRGRPITRRRASAGTRPPRLPSWPGFLADRLPMAGCDGGRWAEGLFGEILLHSNFERAGADRHHHGSDRSAPTTWPATEGVDRERVSRRPHDSGRRLERAAS